MPRPLSEIAHELNLADDEIEPYGKDKAKLSLSALQRRARQPDGKLVLITAINPTPAGEGKTVTTIGLGDGLRKAGKRALVCIREPSLGPTFGVKGGGAGGGRAQAHPADDLNLHFTGDFHAITAAHNLLAALAEAHIYHGNHAHFARHGLTWNRVLDVTDRGLRNVVVGLGGKAHGWPRETGFEITAASELMALLSLCSDYADLRKRMGQLILGVGEDGKPITADRIDAAGAAALLLKDAIRPNLIQTLEGTPLLAHTGPFGNIATGHNSVIEDRLGLKLAEVITTEAGFGSDLGFEKFCHLVAPALGRGPDAVVVVATARGLKAHSGKFALKAGKPLPEALQQEDLEALRKGAANLGRHVANVRQFGLPAVVVINRFPSDTGRELELIEELAHDFGAAAVAVSEGFARGAEGTLPAAEAVLKVLETHPPSFRPLFAHDAPIKEKVETLAKKVYGAAGVEYSKAAEQRLAEIAGWGFGTLPVCVAKTAYSFSHDGDLLGAPSGFVLPVVDVQLAAGAGFVKIFCGDILTMPGLGARPAALRMDLDAEGNIQGLSV
jgi:formate--tetrahydrofolate ligase